jgi:hypothetical protein
MNALYREKDRIYNFKRGGVYCFHCAVSVNRLVVIWSYMDNKYFAMVCIRIRKAMSDCFIHVSLKITRR